MYAGENIKTAMEGREVSVKFTAAGHSKPFYANALFVGHGTNTFLIASFIKSL